MVFDARRINEFLSKDSDDSMSTIPSLLTLRQYPFVFQSDLEAAFLSICVPLESDRRYLGFVHRGSVYRLLRVCFGLRPSPAAMKQSTDFVIERVRGTCPLSESQVCAYVDDLIGGATDRDTGSQLRDSVIGEFERHGFKEAIAKRASNLDEADHGTSTVLGLKWYRGLEEDALGTAPIELPTIEIPNLNTTDGQDQETLNQLRIKLFEQLRKLVPRLYDPLGFHVSLSLFGRHVMQRVALSAERLNAT